MHTFQDQIANDLDAVFFNATAKEFVTTHKISGTRGKVVSPAKELQVIVDSELYQERKMRDKVENVNLNGLVFFVKKEHWLENFDFIPKLESELAFDKKRYLVLAVAEDMGMLEFTIEGKRGR